MLPWKNSWFQIAALAAALSGVCLLMDCAPWFEDFLSSKSAASSPTPAPEEPKSAAVTPTPNPEPVRSWTNSLGMKFNALPGSNVFFSVWETRVQDFREFSRAAGYAPNGGIWAMKVKQNQDGSYSTEWDLDKQASWESPGFEQGSTHPVVGVSWDDAGAFCDWLTKKERASGMIAAFVAYRLPTDAEWSAATGDGKYPWGEDWPPPEGAGNYADDAYAASLPAKGWPQVPGNDGYARTSPVGSFRANRFGYYDMGGNIWEWCGDWYRSDMNEQARLDKVPTLKNDGGGQMYRVIRGASWANFAAEDLWSSARSMDTQGNRDDDVGFRCVLASGGASPTPQPAVPAVQATPDPTPDRSWTNSLGMKFIAVSGVNVLFGVWDTRVEDFREYARETAYVQTGGMWVMKVEKAKDGSYNSKWEVDTGAGWENPGFQQEPTHPVVGVSSIEADAFCDWLTRKEQAAGLIAANQSYRLPTDAEWSLAVGTGRYPWGDDWPPPAGAGNYGDDAYAASLPSTGWPQVPGNDGYARTSPVGSFSANGNGLYDMGGNVWQWCRDRYRARLNDRALLDRHPELKSEGGRNPYHVLRGGSWADTVPDYLLSSIRSSATPDYRCDWIGFRCVLATGPSR